MSTIFAKIIRREIPAFIVAEDESHLAFLDVFPLVEGHVLVIPKKEIDYIFDIADAELANLHVFAKKVAISISKVIPCKKVGLAVVGLEVPHAHIHLVPMQTANDINFSNPKLKLSNERMQEISQLISFQFKQND